MDGVTEVMLKPYISGSAQHFARFTIIISKGCIMIIIILENHVERGNSTHGAALFNPAFVDAVQICLCCLSGTGYRDDK